MAFLYQGRISVLLGTLNELDYKLRLAKYVLLNEDGKGCSPTDTGMLDLSHLSASSSRKFRFAQGEPTLPRAGRPRKSLLPRRRQKPRASRRKPPAPNPIPRARKPRPPKTPLPQRQNSNKEHLNDETGTTVGGRVLYAGAGQLELDIEDIIYDSRKAAPGRLFVCIVGTQRDSHATPPSAWPTA